MNINTKILNNKIDALETQLRTEIQANLDLRINTERTLSNAKENELDSKIRTNISNISTNSSNISSNDDDISTNRSNISTNSSNISSNDDDNDISTNTNDISEIERDIEQIINEINQIHSTHHGVNKLESSGTQHSNLDHDCQPGYYKEGEVINWIDRTNIDTTICKECPAGWSCDGTNKNCESPRTIVGDLCIAPPQKFNNQTLREAVDAKDYEDISNWDVSDVTDMNRLFKDNVNFNENISNWDTSNVTDMSYMFSGATSFNIGNGEYLNWNTNRVTNMSYMFYNATSFNKPIYFDAYWNDSYKQLRGNHKEYGLDMRNMFEGASSFSHMIGGEVQYNINATILENATPCTTETELGYLCHATTGEKVAPRWKVWMNHNNARQAIQWHANRIDTKDMFKNAGIGAENYIIKDLPGLKCVSCPANIPYAVELEQGKYSCRAYSRIEQYRMAEFTKNWRWTIISLGRPDGECTPHSTRFDNLPNPAVIANFYDYDTFGDHHLECIKNSEKVLKDEGILQARSVPTDRNFCQDESSTTLSWKNSHTNNCIHWDPTSVMHYNCSLNTPLWVDE